MGGNSLRMVRSIAPRPLRAMLTALWLGFYSLGLGSAAQTSLPRHPKVYILVIDGLGAGKINPGLTPFIWNLIHQDSEAVTYYPRARSVMPSLTNPNHVSIITGVYPQAHGIVSNYYWDRHTSKPSQRLNLADQVEVETLFTLIEKKRPALETAAILGKYKLAELFKATREGQKGPDYLWTPEAYSSIFQLRGGSLDKRTMDQVIETISTRDPDLLLVNLPEVDLSSHFFGPNSARTEGVIRSVDSQIERLVQYLKDQGKWGETVLMITADHGSSGLREDPRTSSSINFGEVLDQNGFKDVIAVSNGGIELIYLRDFLPSQGGLTPAQAQELKKIRRLALSHPGIEEAWYRLPNPLDGGAEYTVTAAHPGWHLNHRRLGELILVASPGYQFNDPYSLRRAALKGSHGGPYECAIPLLITGGYKALRDQDIRGEAQASNPDLGATVVWLLDLPPPQRLDHTPIPDSLRGRVLSEAFGRE